ncbi:MAG: hypothetical protein IKZ67_03845, partial [Paludibacteraceae bacterium]|nr:hypothetical protein [Paludibacteraceae bacterium]
LRIILTTRKIIRSKNTKGYAIPSEGASINANTEKAEDAIKVVNIMNKLTNNLFVLESSEQIISGVSVVSLCSSITQPFLYP